MESPYVRRINKTVRRPYLRLLLTYITVALLGYAMTRNQTPGAGASGGFTIVVGIGGTLWEMARWVRWWWHRRSVREEARQRGERKAIRAARTAEQRESEHQRKQLDAKAASKRVALQQQERHAEALQKQEAEALRKARFEAVTAEANRLQELAEPRFLNELPALFAIRGLRPHKNAPEKTDPSVADDESCWDLCLMRLEDEALEIVRSVPQERIATVADVEALEQWRKQSGAERAYLVARNGFSAPALRLASHYPITLLEPFVLAQWKISALEAEQEIQNKNFETKILKQKF